MFSNKNHFSAPRIIIIKHNRTTFITNTKSKSKIVEKFRELCDIKKYIITEAIIIFNIFFINIYLLCLMVFFTNKHPSLVLFLYDKSIHLYFLKL